MGLLRAFNVGNILHILRNKKIKQKCIVYKCESFRAYKEKLGSFSQISAAFFFSFCFNLLLPLDYFSLLDLECLLHTGVN